MQIKKKHIIIMVTLTIGLMLRLFLAPHTGYESDMDCFKGWAIKASEGLSKFYTTPGFADYPPGYIYILYLIGKISKVFELPYSSSVFQVLIKLPAILADLWIGFYLYKIAYKRLGEKKAVVITAAYIFNPAIIINGTIWGQVDAVFTVPLIISLGYLYEQKLLGASIWFTICVLIKPQALMLTPIYMFCFYDKVFKMKDYKIAIKSIVTSIAVFIVAIIPFTIDTNPMMIVEKYRTTLESYPYASLNAFNLHTLLGGNWLPVTDPILGVSYQTIGQIGIITTVILAAYYYFRSKNRVNYDLYYIASFIICFVFTTVHKMHERYMFPAIACLLILYVYSQKNQFKWLYILFSIIHFINVGFVLYIYQHGNGLYRKEPIVIALSLVQVVLTTWLVVYPRQHGEKKEEVI
ncbi:MAG: hypothetical protein AB9856_12870 [Cellulosilyticaceae bacterium]